MDQSRIRNFCIVAHIDHGKSTLADRIIEQTWTSAATQIKTVVNSVVFPALDMIQIGRAHV